MWRALFWKELRETAWISLAALGVYLFVVFQCMGVPLVPGSSRADPSVEIPFLSDNFLLIFTMIAAIFAFVLGFFQTINESRQGSWLFLLHRPMGIRQLLWVKLATGWGLYLVISAAAILIYAVWAAAPGTHSNPFAWWMTWPVWRAWGIVSLVYLGTFLSGFRPGRWFGTRLLPLAGIVVPAVFFGVTGGFWPRLDAFLLIAVAGTLVWMILYVAQIRDY
jgi:hypothetical protein